MILHGDALSELAWIEGGFFDCVITSPPYWGLRDYGLEPLVWDADELCEHEWGSEIAGAGKNNDCTAGDKQRTVIGSIGRDNRPTSNFCSRCGAWRGSLGLEPTFQLYIAHLMQIFDEVKQVLKPEGTCWVVIGDTYVSNPGDRAKVGGFQGKANKDRIKAESSMSLNKHKTGLQPKSLCQIPSRFAIAMTDAGWILRNHICWFKRNCMPSSAKDRFTVDWESVFFFVKQKKYWFEQQFELTALHDNGCKNKRCIWDVTTTQFKSAHFAVFPTKLVEPMLSAGCPVDGWVLDPFAGACTVGVVAKEQGKNFIGIEPNPAYIEMGEDRINAVSTKEDG